MYIKAGTMGEKEAIIRLKQGDEAAFSYLYKLYWAKAHHFARLYTASAHMAEEVVQEVFIKLWENRAGLDEEQGLDGYLFIATRNLLFNHARDSLNREAYRATVLEAMEEAYSIEEELDAADLKAYIDQVVGQLPPRQQEVFCLSREQHLNYNEIALRLQISVKTVERHMGEALKFLRRNLKLYSWLLHVLFFLP